MSVIHSPESHRFARFFAFCLIISMEGNARFPGHRARLLSMLLNLHMRPQSGNSLSDEEREVKDSRRCRAVASAGALRDTSAEAACAGTLGASEKAVSAGTLRDGVRSGTSRWRPWRRRRGGASRWSPQRVARWRPQGRRQSPLRKKRPAVWRAFSVDR